MDTVSEAKFYRHYACEPKVLACSICAAYHLCKNIRQEEEYNALDVQTPNNPGCHFRFHHRDQNYTDWQLPG